MPLALPSLPLSLDESLVTPELWAKAKERYDEAGAVTFKGGVGSGFFGHAGRVGKRGGSSPNNSGDVSMSVSAVGDPRHPKAPIPEDPTESINLIKVDRLEGLPKDKEGIRGYWIDENNTLYSDDSKTLKGDWSGGFHTYSMAQIIYNRYEYDKIGKLAIKVIDGRDFENQEIEHWGLENGYIKVRSMEGIPGHRNWSEPSATITVLHANRASLRRIQKLIDNGLILRAKDYTIISLDADSPAGINFAKIPAFDLMSATSIVPEKQPDGNGFILKEFRRALKGGAGSGFYGHAGRVGKRGGSAPQGGSVSASEGVLRITLGNNVEMDLDQAKRAPVSAPKTAKKGVSFAVRNPGNAKLLDEFSGGKYGEKARWLYKRKPSAENEDYLQRYEMTKAALRGWIGMFNKAPQGMKTIVARSNGDIVGALAYDMVENIMTREHLVKVDYLGSMENGIGLGLMKKVAGIAKKKGVGMVLFSVERAVQFYEKLGMKNGGVVPEGNGEIDGCTVFSMTPEQVAQRWKETDQEPVEFVKYAPDLSVLSKMARNVNDLQWKTLAKELRKKYNVTKESHMAYAEIEVFGKKAVLTEKGWECDQPDIVKVLNLELQRPLDGYEPDPAAAFAERAAKLMGGKVVSIAKLETPETKDGKQVVY